MKEIIIVFPFMHHAPVIPIMRDFYRDATDVEPVGTDTGIDPVATYSDVEFMIPGILERIVKAEKDGCRAAIVGCFGDPGLAAAREMVAIPVLGPGETAFAVASTLGDKIMVLEPEHEFVYPTEKMIAAYGYKDKVVGVHHLDLPLEACVTGLTSETEEAKEMSRRVADDVCKRVEDASPHVIILGCIGLAGFMNIVSSALKERGFNIPIVEPGIVAMRYARFLLDLELNQSRQMWRP
jgi:allantoin racemase